MNAAQPAGPQPQLFGVAGQQGEQFGGVLVGCAPGMRGGSRAHQGRRRRKAQQQHAAVRRFFGWLGGWDVRTAHTHRQRGEQGGMCGSTRF